MTDPKRWTDGGSDATAVERALLSAGQQVMLPPEERRKIWSNVALRCSALAAAGAVAKSVVSESVAPQGAAHGLGTAAAVTGAKLSVPVLVKGVVAVSAVLGLTLGGYWAVERVSAPATETEQGAVSKTPVVAPTANSPVERAMPETSEKPREPAEPASDRAPTEASEPGAVADTRSPASAERRKAKETAEKIRSKLREESAAVLEIRRTLRSGDAGGALRLLEKARRQFPKGALGQEREALTIEALSMSGARDRAARRAQAFLRAYPKSPYAADVQRFATQ